MSTTARKYQTKAVPATAVQFTGENVDEVVTFLAPFGGPHNPRGANAAHPISVLDSHGRVRDVRSGDWVVYTKPAGLLVVSAFDFAQGYEEVEGEGEGEAAEPITAKGKRERHAKKAAVEDE